MATLTDPLSLAAFITPPTCPYSLPTNQYIAGWKSLTQGGDPARNFHQILMSDDQGGEVVHIHAESMFIVNQESIACSQRPSASLNLQG